ncbi:MAG TPA: hypothetical protein VGN16_20515, partial [Acidobacteriaceae bacterium]
MSKIFPYVPQTTIQLSGNVSDVYPSSLTAHRDLHLPIQGDEYTWIYRCHRASDIHDTYRPQAE